MSEQDVLDKLTDVLSKLADAQELIGETKDEVLKKRVLERICHHCNATGIKPGWSDPQSGSTSCPDCGGTGYTPIGRRA